MAIKRISRKAKWLLAILTIASILTAVNAYVFVFYPVTISLQPVAPAVVFDAGKGANQTDLQGKKIQVVLDKTNTTLTLTIHPTWRTNLYMNFTIIKNLNSSMTYYIMFNVTQTFINTKITQAKLFVKTLTGALVATVNLLSTGLQPANWITISGGGKYRLDLLITFTPGSGDTPSTSPPSDTAQFQLVYSPQNSVNPSQ